MHEEPNAGTTVTAGKIAAQVFSELDTHATLMGLGGRLLAGPGSEGALSAEPNTLSKMVRGRVSEQDCY
jgi:hypothetical protein